MATIEKLCIYFRTETKKFAVEIFTKNGSIFLDDISSFPESMEDMVKRKTGESRFEDRVIDWEYKDDCFKLRLCCEKTGYYSSFMKYELNKNKDYLELMFQCVKMEKEGVTGTPIIPIPMDRDRKLNINTWMD